MNYKDTPFGYIPDDWGLSPISEVTELVTDYVANGSFASLAENVKYNKTEDAAVLIRLVDYNNGFKGGFVFIDEHAYNFLSKSKLYGDEIIISNVGANVGTVFRCPHLPYKMSLAPNSIMVKFKGNDSFYYYWLKSKAGQHMLHSIVTGSAQPKFNKTNFRDMLVPVPPEDIQEKIVAILQPLDNKIELNNRINENLEQQAHAIYNSWFIYFTQNDGMKPSSWLDATLDDLTCLVTRGITPKYNEETDQIVLNQKCVRNHTIDLAPSRHHLPKAITEKWLKQGDLLINSTGEGTLGRVAQVWFEPKNMTVDSHITIVRPKDELLKYYIGLWGMTHEKQIEEQHTGSTGQTELPRERVKAMKILKPDNDTLSSLNDLISPIASCIVTNQEESLRLSMIRDILLPKLMSGELDVSNIDI